jgi:hypothetical protein
MKLQNKTKTKAKRRNSRKPLQSLSKVVLVHGKKSSLRHFRLVNHAHTGRLIHHSHTSHLSLVVMLALVAVFMFVGSYYAQAVTSNGSVTIGLVVPGPAPTVGAKILSPKNNTKLVDKTVVTVSGSCAPETFVVVSGNNLPVGSDMCTSEGIFAIEVQLQFGTNKLTALNYDSLNQAGPETPIVTVYVTNSQDKKPPTVPVAPVSPLPPNNPSVVPGVDSKFDTCNDYKIGELETGGEPRVLVVCSPRIFGPGLEQVLGVLVWGGTPPYAVSVNWGDDTTQDTLISIAEPGYHTIKVRYTFPGIYRVAFRLKDKAGDSSVVQTAVQVSGEVIQPGYIDNEVINTSWFNISVPIYMLAVAITLGFWGGDIFNRKFGVASKRHKRHKAA